MKRTLLSLAAFLAIGVTAASIYLSPVANAQTETAQPATAANSIVISSRGALSQQGQYSQTSGSFSRFVAGTPSPTVSPSPTPTCVPRPGLPATNVYSGSYSLSDGETGPFGLAVGNGSTDATVLILPDDLTDDRVVTEQGPATVTLGLDPATGIGSGSIKFTSSGVEITGTITTDHIVQLPPRDPVTCGASPTPTPTPQFAVMLSGRVVGPDGRGLKDVQVRLDDGSATTLTSSLGFYQLGADAGSTVTILVSSKRYRFSPRTVTAATDTPNIDFIGIE